MGGIEPIGILFFKIGSYWWGASICNASLEMPLLGPLAIETAQQVVNKSQTNVNWYMYVQIHSSRSELSNKNSKFQF